jgi:hypothetical protein
MSEPNVDYLTLRDLHLESQLSNLSKHSIPSKEVQGEPPTNLINSPVSDINLKDVGLEEQLQKISRNTIKEVWGWKPTPIKSFVTQEMIQEYQDELANSHYKDPITGKTFKYVPVNTDVQLEEVPSQKPTLNFNEKERIFRERIQLVEELKQEHQVLDQIRNALKRLQDSEFVSEADYIRIFTTLKSREEQSLEQIKNIEYEISNIGNIVVSSDRNETENKANEYEVSKRNRALLKQKSDELNLLNRGKLNLTQQPNESDEEFKQRIIDAGQIEFDESYIQEAASRRTIEKFKSNMKEITPNNVLIETIVKRVSPERIFLYNKYFSSLKRVFIERYGRHKFTEDEAGEIIDVFDSILETVVYKKKPDLLGEVDLLAPTEPNDRPEQVFDDTEFALQMQPKSEFATPQKKQPFNEAWVKHGSRVNYTTPWDMSKNKLEEVYGDLYRKRISREPPSSKKKFLQYLYDNGDIEAPRFGSGIKVEHTSQLHDKKLTKFAPLGSIAINPKALYYENTLILKTHRRSHFSGYNKIRVSDNFVTIIMKMLEGIEPTHHDIRKLDLKEKELYDQVIHLAQLHKKVEHNLDQTRQAMKHRFELLHGELGAGNNNREIKHELMNLVQRMAHAKMISHTDAKKYLKGL